MYKFYALVCNDNVCDYEKIVAESWFKAREKTRELNARELYVWGLWRFYRVDGIDEAKETVLKIIRVIIEKHPFIYPYLDVKIIRGCNYDLRVFSHYLCEENEITIFYDSIRVAVKYDPTLNIDKTLDEI